MNLSNALGSSRGVAHPRSGLSKQRRTHISAQAQFFATFGQVSLQAVRLAGRRVDNRAVSPTIALSSEMPKYSHSQDRLIPELSRTRAADSMRWVARRWEALDDFALQFVSDRCNLNNASQLMGGRVEGLLTRDGGRAFAAPRR
jgi:hypothetical protein